MKRFFLFTLTVLWATAFLGLTNTHAFKSDRDASYKIAGNIYGVAYVGLWYQAPYAKSNHYVTVSNYGNGTVKLYGDYWARVTGPGWASNPKEDDDEMMVKVNQSRSPGRTFSFSLSGRPPARYTISGWTTLRVRDDVNNTTVGWRADTSYSFRHE